VTGRCQRCGSGCEGQLCPACQAFTATLQTLVKRYPAVDPQQPRPDRRGSPAAKPPAEVVQTFKAAGSLQLHRFSEPVRFYCVTCTKYKKADRAAITNGDWKRAVCNSCYRVQIKTEQGKVKKAAKPARSPAKTKQRPPKEAKAGRLERRNGLLARPAIVKGQVEQLTHRPSGIDSLVGFFRAGGIDAQLGPGGDLRIDGSQIGPLNHVPSPETAEWVNAVNEIALKYVRGKFISAVENNTHFGVRFGASLLPADKGVAIMRGGERLAVIYPAHASIPRGRLVYANFLTPGPHWEQVANALRKRTAGGPAAARDAKAEPVTGQRRTPTKAKAAKEHARPRRIDRLPDDLAPELIKACLDASRRIRLERQLDYGDAPVVLQSDAGELTLLPITGTESRLLVPFRLSTGTKSLNGKLILGDRDPLPVLIGRGVADEDAIMAWTCALLGFADATCIELDPAGQAARHERPRPRQRPRSPAARPRLLAPALPRRRRWPSYLEPVGRTARYLDSLVAGHRRHLPDGWTASDEARDRARRIGIRLNTHETWVQPHTRGLPDGIEMRFLWHAPTELKLSR
jgi:hypothetical protein